MRAIATLAALLLPAALIALPAGPAAADCAEIDATIKEALAAKNTGEYESLYKTMSEDPSCDATYRDQVGRTMARSMLTTLTTDTDPQTIDATTTRYGRPWQVLVAIGDAYYERKDWANAVKIYEEALDDIGAEHLSRFQHHLHGNESISPFMFPCINKWEVALIRSRTIT